MKPAFLLLASVALVAPSAHAQRSKISDFVSPEQQFESARKLRDSEQQSEAFWAFLRVAGGEEAAAKIARPKAREFLDALKTPHGGVSEARFQLLQGELRFVLGERESALESFRSAQSEWAKDRRENGFYPVEAPAQPRDRYAFSPRDRLDAPFSLGPGSHRDNWLVRRFIALGAFDDAAREFARVWKIHQQYARRYRYEQAIYDEKTKTSKPLTFLVSPSGFDEFALQFAVDYAYFLKRQNQIDAALAVLREPLDAMNLDARDATILRLWATSSDAPLLPMRNLARGIGLYSGIAPRFRGLTPQEFVRLAWGEWKSQNKTGELISALQSQTEGGQNSARRVLALVRRHEGNLPTAQKLELEFIENEKFSLFARATRRAAIYREFNQPREAAKELERALTLRVEGESPISDEVPSSRQTIDAASAVHSQIRAQLIQIYSASGNTARVLQLTLQNFEDNPRQWDNFDALSLAQQRFNTARAGATWTTWLRVQTPKQASPLARANGFWLLGNRSAALQSLEQLARKQPDSWELARFQTRFAARGAASNLAFLQTIARALPNNPRWQLALLRAQNKTGGPDYVRSLELLLQSANGTGRRNTLGGNDTFGRRGPFVGGRPNGSRTEAKGEQWKNAFEVAVRLMRLYDESGHNAKTQSLALQIARGDKPFGVPDFDSYDEPNGARELGEAALAFAVARGNPAQRQSLEKALAKSPWTGAKAQLARLRVGLAAPKNAPFGWSKPAPDGAKVLASVENVLALARDEKHLFSGHPWGVAVYDLKGNPVTRVALGSPALHLARLGGALFVGGAQGLWRVDTGKWSVQSVALPLSQGNWGQHGLELSKNITALAVRDEKLWLATRLSVGQFNPRTRELDVWKSESLGMDSAFTVHRFVFDRGFVWIDADEGCRRFDAQSGLWRAPRWKGAQPREGSREPVQLVDIVDGQAWGDVYVNDRARHRPAVIDSQTLEVRPLRVEGESDGSDQFMCNSVVSFFGKWRGQSVWGDDTPRFFLDASTGKMRPLPRDEDGTMTSQAALKEIKSDAPRGLAKGKLRRRSDGALVALENGSERLGNTPFLSSSWTSVPLSSGAFAVGGSFVNVADYAHRYGGENGEWPFGEFARQTPDGAGGLHLLSSTGVVKTVSRVARPDLLWGDVAFDAVPDAARRAVWLATESGLAGVQNGSVFARLTRRDGLLGNRLTSAAQANGRLFFASRWDDDGGGLVAFDPKTTLLFSAFDVDGLPSNALERVQTESDGRVRLEFGVQYRRWSDFKNQQQPPGWFDPKSGAFSPRQNPRVFGRDGGAKIGKPLGTMPVLGGFIIARRRIEGKLWLLGTRGAVIEGARPASSPTFARIAVKVRPDAREVALNQANRRPLQLSSIAQLRVALADSNPFYRARALAMLLGSTALQDPQARTLILARVGDSDFRVRATAMGLLLNLPAKTVISPEEVAGQVAAFRARLNDENEDEVLQNVAMLGLLRRDVLPPQNLLRARLVGRDDSNNVPFGADSSMGMLASREQLLRALAPLADEEVFAVLLEAPPSLGSTEFDRTVFPALGAALLRHPEAAPVLLRAYDGQPHERLQRDFAQNVFRFAGKGALPLLHTALESSNRVVRSNAARALGAIKDPSSAPLLLKSLDLESGLSRASIVWALGELRAREALPTLARLYTELQNAPASNAGFMMAQSMAQNTRQYASINANAEATSSYAALQSVEGVAKDYDELSVAQLKVPLDPRRDEELLSSSHILEAVGKIAPQTMGDWYRALAATNNAQARREAAIHLAPGTPKERAQNGATLRNLLSDTSPSVQLSAAVSLLTLGHNDGQKIILAAFDSNPAEVLRELARVNSSEKLAFALPRIKAIAGDKDAFDELRAHAQRLLAR